MSVLHPVLQCFRKRDLPLPTLDNPGSGLMPTVTCLRRKTLPMHLWIPAHSPALLCKQLSLPPLPPRIARSNSHVGKACLSDCRGNGLYGSQHGVEQLCQLPCRSFNASSLLHNESRERQHIRFKGAFVRHFCWVLEFLSSRLDEALSCCAEILGSCFILRQSCWLRCRSVY